MRLLYVEDNPLDADLARRALAQDALPHQVDVAATLAHTEDEVMLSNMVREGQITRDEAMARTIEYAKPRWPSIREYAQLIGFSTDEALQIINAMPKFY